MLNEDGDHPEARLCDPIVVPNLIDAFVTPVSVLVIPADLETDIVTLPDTFNLEYQLLNVPLYGEIISICGCPLESPNTYTNEKSLSAYEEVSAYELLIELDAHELLIELDANIPDPPPPLPPFNAYDAVSAYELLIADEPKLPVSIDSPDASTH